MYALTGRECIFYILRKWKRILLIAVVCGLLLGSFKCVKEVLHWNVNKSYRAQAAIDYEREYSYVKSLTDIYNAQISAKQEERAVLQEFSINNNLGGDDASDLYRAEAVLVFGSTLPDGSFYPVSADIIEQFEDKIYALTDWNAVAGAGAVDVGFARSTFGCHFNEDNSSLELSILGYSEDKSTGMMNVILADCGDIEADFEETYTGLHMDINNQTCAVIDSSDVVALFSDNIDRIEEIDEEISLIQIQIEKLSYPAAPSSLPYEAQVVLNVLKNALIGAAIGAAFTIVLLYLAFYLNGKIHSAEEFEYYTGSYVLTTWKKGTKSRGLSHLIAVKENRDLIYDKKEAVERLLSNIVSANKGVQSVVITGTNVDDELSELTELVKTNNHGISNFAFAPNIMTDIDAFEAIKEDGLVVVVERIDSISVTEVRKEIEQIKLSGSSIAGAILLR